LRLTSQDYSQTLGGYRNKSSGARVAHHCPTVQECKRNRRLAVLLSFGNLLLLLLLLVVVVWFIIIVTWTITNIVLP